MYNLRLKHILGHLGIAPKLSRQISILKFVIMLIFEVFFQSLDALVWEMALVLHRCRLALLPCLQYFFDLLILPLLHILLARKAIIVNMISFIGYVILIILVCLCGCMRRCIGVATHFVFFLVYRSFDLVSLVINQLLFEKRIGPFLIRFINRMLIILLVLWEENDDVVHENDNTEWCHLNYIWKHTLPKGKVRIDEIEVVSVELLNNIENCFVDVEVWEAQNCDQRDEVNNANNSRPIDHWVDLAQLM